ncbi:hypothetical protein CEXT_146111 [Caerostris extrusa]|uniref:C2H2-type domain-containing protein n=1 Tax=Caerostris extrusa TaxID=172846 RepID=A0AAV4YF24_CAEEX|nr:hypothetical protein CEXT_146111 [Caerostris extrusa]
MEENENNSETFEENPNNYPCGICEKTFTSKRRLKKHLLFHVTINKKEEERRNLLKKERSKTLLVKHVVNVLLGKHVGKSMFKNMKMEKQL